VNEPADLVEELFRREWASVIAALTRLLGPSQLALAEDVAQDALERAMIAWTLTPPLNPKAWLLETARRCAIDRIRRSQRENRLAERALDAALSEMTVDAVDDQLAMMFSVCDEALGPETHVTLILRFLCGFGPHEIAQAFIVDVGTVDRRLHRGRNHLRALGALADISDPVVIEKRRPSVLHALYLMFNEGYQSSDSEEPMHPAVCTDALRLAELLLEAPSSSRAEVHALAALFCFHAARLPARLDDRGVFVRLAEQDRSRWDVRLIERGVLHLSESAAGLVMTRWHIEAGIAAEHALATSMTETNWKRIADLYRRLRVEAPSPVVEIGYAMALAELDGVAAGREILRGLEVKGQLAAYPAYWAARAELEGRLGNPVAERECFERARSLARNDADREAYERRLHKS
jgi:RNA polymerase sigma factor (sigma-70 family)